MKESRRRLAPAALLCAGLVVAFPAGAQMYKWVDERGAVTYSNTPPPSTAQAKKVDIIEERVSTYTPDPLISRALAEEAAEDRDAKGAGKRQREFEAERRALASEASATASAAAQRRAAQQQAAYERCLADRRVDCESIRSGAPGDASYGYDGYYGPHYVVGARVPFPPQAPFYVEDKPPTRVGVSTAQPVGISTAPKVGIDDRPPVGAPPRERAVGRFR